MNKVRWGIIGCGDVTEKKSGPGFQKAEGSELVAVMRRNREKAEDYARRHRVPRWYDSADELVNDPEVNAVYVATPPSSHLEYTLLAAEAGKPVYVEKPMALNSGEAEEMVKVCQEQGVSLFVAYYRRAQPRFLKVKELLDSKIVGDIHGVQVKLHMPPSQRDMDKDKTNWRVDPEVAGGGYFMDLASHTLDLLDFLLGPISEAKGIAVNIAGLYKAEDNVTAVFRWEEGITGIGSWRFTVGEQLDQVELSGTEGTILFSMFDDNPVFSRKPGKKAEEYLIPHPEHVQQPLIQSVTDKLLGKGECPSTGDSGLRTTRIMENILSDYYEAL